jgi:hypothetical protein
MDILNSGSFVPLDNREKIDQLIFTATTLATEVSRAEGFQSSGSTNHELGLEMWKGAEYMCRAHEEATIRNLFLSKFLERLREIERHHVQPRAVQAEIPIAQAALHGRQDLMPDVPQPQFQPVPTAFPIDPFQEKVSDPKPRQGRDEYLGVVFQTLETESGRKSYADECKPEFERDFAEMSASLEEEESVAMAADSNEVELRESIASNPPQAGDPTAISANDTDFAASGIKEESVREEGCTTEPPAVNTAPGVASIVLSEIEPYNFDSCTVTAVIQLLPESSGIRKSVISIRSHDFAPKISISEIANEHIQEGINRCLETALGHYRNNLPLLAAEKVKKQKSAGKKSSKKVDEKDIKVGSVSDDKKTVGSTVPPATQGSGADKNQQNLFAS